MTAKIEVLRDRAGEIAGRVLALHEQLIANPDNDSLDQVFEDSVAEIRAAEETIAVAVRKEGGQQ